MINCSIVEMRLTMRINLYQLNFRAARGGLGTRLGWGSVELNAHKKEREGFFLIFATLCFTLKRHFPGMFLVLLDRKSDEDKDYVVLKA